MTRLKLWFQSERAKLHPLSPTQRAEYIWDYYKIWILSILAIVAFVGTTLGQRYGSSRDPWFSVCLVNVGQDLGEGSPLYEGFAQYAGYDLDEKDLIFQTDLYCQPSSGNNVGNVYYEMLVSLLDAGSVDAVVMGTADLTALGESGRLLDLSSQATADIYETYGTQFVYCQAAHPDTGEMTAIPVGVDLSQTVLAEWYGGDCALGISAQAPHLDQVITFLSYLHEGASA